MEKTNTPNCKHPPETGTESCSTADQFYEASDSPHLLFNDSSAFWSEEDLNDEGGDGSRAQRCPQQKKPEQNKAASKATGEEIPSFKTSWKINPEIPSHNFRVLTSEYLPPPEKTTPPVVVPSELVSLVSDLHIAKPEERQRIVEKLFPGNPKNYVHNCFYRVDPNTWTVFWDPERVPELSTLTVQSFICAALNSRRRLKLVLGVRADSKIVGCEWSDETRAIMQKEFEFCVSREFVPALDEEVVRFRFHPVLDDDGCEMPFRYIAEISIDDVVEEVYQLSSGRIYYAVRKNVREANSISEALRIFSGKNDDMTGNPERNLSYAPYLGDAEPPDSVFMWFLSRLIMFALPGFLTGWLAYGYLPRLARR